MPHRTALLTLGALLAGLLLTSCGRSKLPPEAIVRAWGDAVNSGDNERAAKLLADDAIIVWGAEDRVLREEADAVAWNAARRCSGLVQSITTHGDIVTATFQLDHRRDRGSCPTAGGTETVEFEVRRKHIVFLRRLASTPPR